MRGLFIKKMIFTWRNRVVTGVQLFLPVIFTFLGLTALNSAAILDDPPLTFNLKQFDDPIAPYYVSSTDDNATRFGKIYSTLFQRSIDVAKVSYYYC